MAKRITTCTHPKMDPWERERRKNAKSTKMTIESRVPSKWRFVDLETGDVWKWDVKTARFVNANQKFILHDEG